MHSDDRQERPGITVDYFRRSSRRARLLGRLSLGERDPTGSPFATLRGTSGYVPLNQIGSRPQVRIEHRVAISKRRPPYRPVRRHALPRIFAYENYSAAAFFVAFARGFFGAAAFFLGSAFGFAARLRPFDGPFAARASRSSTACSIVRLSGSEP